MDLSILPPNRKIGSYVYNVQAFLGQGAYGEVYLGHPDNNSNVDVAIKKMDLKKLRDPELQKSLNNELSILKMLGGPNNCGLIDQLRTSTNQYIIQPLCNGGDMRSFLTKYDNIPEKQALIILQQCLKGMREMYINDLAHRDLKPENILINDDTFLIADYGFSTFTHGQPMTTKLGTPLYMSPQVHLCQPYTMKNDVWAIGMIYYEILCGKTPWPVNCERDLYEMPKKMPIIYPADVQISRMSQQFIQGCLQYEEHNRLGWEQIFQSQIYLDPQSGYESRVMQRMMYPEVVEFIVYLQQQMQQYQISSSDVFRQFDISQDNVLDINEFIFLVQKVSPNIPVDVIQQFFGQVSGMDGKFSLDEFNRMIHTEHEQNEVQNYLIHEMRAKNVVKYLADLMYRQVLSIQDILLRFDINRDGGLQVSELCQLLKYYDPQVTVREVEYLFNIIDKNRNGQIDINELIDFFEIELVDRGYQMIQTNDYMMSDHNLLANIISRNNVNLNKLLPYFDNDKNFALSFDEFVQFIMKVEKRKITIDRLQEMFRDLSQGRDSIQFRTILEVCGQ